nr:ras-related protein Rab-26-like [Pseudochaenichthys georgianus]
MDDGCETQRQEERTLVSSDSAYGSSAVDTDTEDGQTSTSNPFPYNEDLTHKTILVGDSGVGKTSLLVQFDQGKFLPGSFTATVGIGFTVNDATASEDSTANEGPFLLDVCGSGE